MKLRNYLLTSAALFAFPFNALALDPINKDYVKSLVNPTRSTVVIEYSDANGKVIERKGFATPKAWKAISPNEFIVSNDIKLKLFGLEPCKGDMVVRSEDFTGTCNDYAQANLQVMLNGPKVLYCRSFITEMTAPVQDTTCYGYYVIPGAVDSVDNLEEQLVSIGALRVKKKPDNSLVRPDLAEAMEIAQKGYGMWADPRHK